MPFQMHLDSKHASPDRTYRKFTLDRPGTIILVGHHLSTSARVRCLVRSITLEGAVLEVAAGIEVPHHFFLEIMGIDDEIGCTLVKREESVVTISFNMLIKPEFLQHVLRLNVQTVQ